MSPSPSNSHPTEENSSRNHTQTLENELEKEEEEDEDEDFDFNPFFRSTPSPEASSSLSSENEGFQNKTKKAKYNDSELVDLWKQKENNNDDDEEVVMQSGCNPIRVSKDDIELKENTESKEEAFLGQDTGTGITHCGDNEGVDNVEDPICRRTRARYSLANFSLDELEVFLQETDDDEDPPNVDDEEEYRKFLAAVLLGGDEDGKVACEDGNVDDDEDEENDADFEIEIEEALESDVDENVRVGIGRKRPVTRQKRMQKASDQSKKKLLGQAKMPLRPLLPSVSKAPMVPLDKTALTCPAPVPRPGSMYGFTAHQIGQLHCLIHEHVQLLVQVYSLSILEPSKQHIASGIEKMILQMADKREEVLARRKVPYPRFCFRPPYIHPSVSEELPKSHRMQETVINRMPISHNAPSVSEPDERHNENFHGRHLGPCQTTENSAWQPLVSEPVSSVLDVAPLSLLGRYLDDVSTAVREHTQRHVEASYADGHFERKPLFPFQSSASINEASNEYSKASSPSPGHLEQQPKKTLAASLVENTKKQTVALVPKSIAKLAQRFFPLFNSALFPHKPPPAAIANRVLFTDSEDELLAMGLMEYNNDWKAIQQRFLPCKSKHQIFVRQKNRSSSKAPENPIKAVRRMKASPLSAEEKALIHEGLKVLKLDWMSVWKFFVPHRDPSLLPRQWRIALGTQKSYKTSDSEKEKRRLYESRRRKNKAALTNLQNVPVKEVDNVDVVVNSSDDNMDDEDEAYVHEAFLADWNPGISRLLSSDIGLSSVNNSNLQSVGIMPQEGTHFGEKWAGFMNEYGDPQKNIANLQHLSHFTHARSSVPYTLTSNQLASKPSYVQKTIRPYRMRRRSGAQLVKLAPDLPPVNLPPSVHVISQSAFKTYHGESSSSKISGSGTDNMAFKTYHGESSSSKISGSGTDNLVSRLLHVAKSVTAPSGSAGKNRNVLPNIRIESPCQQDPRTSSNQDVSADNGAELDMQMHPLLFQAPEDGCFPYFPINYSADASSTFSFLPGNPLQATLNLFRKPQHSFSITDRSYPALKSKETLSNLCTIDFHPLLQGTDNVNSDPVIVSPAIHPSCNSESLEDNCAQISNPSASFPTMQQVDDDGWTAATAPNSPNVTANELDLDIHLSSVDCKGKSMGTRGGAEHNINRSSIVSLEHKTMEESHRANVQSYHDKENCPLTSIATTSNVHSGKNTVNTDLQTRACNKTHVDAHMVLSSNAISKCTEDNIGSNSLPEIVMEQEELSDSDEEIEEDVEFECEEMTDSEGEGLDCEQLVDMQTKVATVTSEEGKIVTHEEFSSRPKITDQQNNIRVTKGNMRPCKLGSMGPGKKNTGSLIQLDIISVSSCSKQKRETGNEGHQTIENSGNGIRARPSRTSKRKPNKDITLQPSEKPQLHSSAASVECNSVTSARQPRKRACRTKSVFPSCENIVNSPNNVGGGDLMTTNVICLETLPPETNNQANTEPEVMF
ncbi:homeodomain-like superfamily protein isoform X2 [Tasmannia lanceolata]|uniref:homeodomain-like superfamily protein isoform X2 n=1 Tax=Tasmannia lanceolata TaxID=3420 RepID=UPI00406474DC